MLMGYLEYLEQENLTHSDSIKLDFKNTYKEDDVSYVNTQLKGKKLQQGYNGYGGAVTIKFSSNETKNIWPLRGQSEYRHTTTLGSPIQRSGILIDSNDFKGFNNEIQKILQNKEQGEQAEKAKKNKLKTVNSNETIGPQFVEIKVTDPDYPNAVKHITDVLQTESSKDLNPFDISDQGNASSGFIEKINANPQLYSQYHNFLLKGYNISTENMYGLRSSLTLARGDDRVTFISDDNYQGSSSNPGNGTYYIVSYSVKKLLDNNRLSPVNTVVQRLTMKGDQ